MASSEMTFQPDPAAVDQQHGLALESWAEMMPRLSEPELVRAVDAAGRAVLTALADGAKLLVMGNGGSAAMASHIAAEFAGKCVIDRTPLPAISLAESSTAVTAVGNDYGFDQVFVRGVRALGQPGDVLLAMSTSGTSVNILAALRAAESQGLTTILLTGEGQVGQDVADHVLRVPSSSTPRIQEVHLLWSHSWCEGVDVAWAAQS